MRVVSLLPDCSLLHSVALEESFRLLSYRLARSETGSGSDFASRLVMIERKEEMMWAALATAKYLVRPHFLWVCFAILLHQIVAGHWQSLRLEDRSLALLTLECCDEEFH